MHRTLNLIMTRIATAVFSVAFCVIGFLVSRWMTSNDATIQATQVQLLQIQKDIKNIEVLVSAINAKQLTTEQVRIIASEVATAKVNEAILSHVRKAHEQK